MSKGTGSQNQKNVIYNNVLVVLISSISLTTSLILDLRRCHCYTLLACTYMRVHEIVYK